MQNHFEHPFEFDSGLWPWENYEEMLRNLPPDSAYRPYISYGKRYLFHATSGFWGELFKELVKPYKNATALLARDMPGYTIGPHTDSGEKKQTFIFYLTDREVEGAGTAIFVPKKEGLTSNGDVHYKERDFRLFYRVPYVPRGYFHFCRSDNSFHGVTKVDCVRNAIQLAVYE